MTNYEKITKFLSYGFQVKCQDTDGDWTIYFSMRNNGDVRCSDVYSNVEHCYDTLGINSEKDYQINNQTFTTIEPIIKVPKLFKVGDLVDVAEEYTKHLSGQKGLEIKFVDVIGYYQVWTEDKNDYWAIPFWAVTPHLEDKSDNKKLIEEAEKKMKEAKEIIKRLS